MRIENEKKENSGLGWTELIEGFEKELQAESKYQESFSWWDANFELLDELDDMLKDDVK